MGEYLMKKCLIIISFIISNVFAVNAMGYGVQDQIKEEYGNCYNTFQDRLQYCEPSVCYYPDLNDSKAWKAQAIRGVVEDNKCYVIYYSYIGNETIGEPDHCYYNKMQKDILSQYYKALFTSNSVIKITEIKDKINRFESYYNNCSKSSSK